MNLIGSYMCSCAWNLHCMLDLSAKNKNVSVAIESHEYDVWYVCKSRRHRRARQQRHLVSWGRHNLWLMNTEAEVVRRRQR